MKVSVKYEQSKKYCPCVPKVFTPTEQNATERWSTEERLLLNPVKTIQPSAAASNKALEVKIVLAFVSLSLLNLTLVCLLLLLLLLLQLPTAVLRHERAL